MAKNYIFDVEQLIFARLREGISKLGPNIMHSMHRQDPQDSLD
jgi:hypothetical protein